ncbi:MAG: alpha/beta hydrolase [bacterium]
MNSHDDELIRFQAEGAHLPATADHGYVEHDGARIWYACFGSGDAVILLHGGLGHSGNWSHQVSALIENGYRAIVVDSRGHGRSSRDDRPFTYERMTFDLLAVMDALNVEKASLVGWSDGAVVALMLAASHPARVARVFFFACNMDPSGVRPNIELTPTVMRCLSRHKQDYARLSETPDQFDAFSDAVGVMQRTQPNYTADDLRTINVPVVIVQSEHDEFISLEHAEYLARTIPAASLVVLQNVSHFAPLQRPAQFNEAMLAFLD